LQGVGMNNGRHRQNQYQHQDGYIPYGHTRYAHVHTCSMHGSALL
jgi:hypothetical protein